LEIVASQLALLATREAIRRFQRGIGAEITGQLTAEEGQPIGQHALIAADTHLWNAKKPI
jgi:hypothetical protein